MRLLWDKYYNIWDDFGITINSKKASPVFQNITRYTMVYPYSWVGMMQPPVPVDYWDPLPTLPVTGQSSPIWHVVEKTAVLRVVKMGKIQGCSVPC